MRIRDLADKPGTAHRWSSRDRAVTLPATLTGCILGAPQSQMVRSIYHYSTEMVWFTIGPDGQFDDNIVEAYIGNGSKSDQDGVNTILARIGARLAYYRNGDDPRIEELDDRHFRYPVSENRPRRKRHGWRFPKRKKANFTFTESEIDEVSDWAKWVVS